MVDTDLTEITATQSVKIIGSDSTATETNPMNVDSSGHAYTTDKADGPVTPGTVATKSILGAGQYNSPLPSLTTGQQVAFQVDASGRMIIRLISSANDSIAAVQSGTWNIGTVTTVTSITNPV